MDFRLRPRVCVVFYIVPCAYIWRIGVCWSGGGVTIVVRQLGGNKFASESFCGENGRGNEREMIDVGKVSCGRVHGALRRVTGTRPITESLRSSHNTVSRAQAPWRDLAGGGAGGKRKKSFEIYFAKNFLFLNFLFCDPSVS